LLKNGAIQQNAAESGLLNVSPEKESVPIAAPLPEMAGVGSLTPIVKVAATSFILTSC